MADRLRNKVAVIIGSSSGIGAAIAQRFSKEGARVYATSRSAAGTIDRPSVAGEVRAIRADAASLTDLKQAFSTIRSAGDHIDVLVINAGTNEIAPLGAITENQFDSVFGLNVRALVFAVQTALDLMRAGGSIVLIGSIADVIGRKGYSVYGASKSAVRSLARTWSNELGAKGIRVNVVSPGAIVTSRLAQASDEQRSALAALVPLCRLGSAEEVAAAALFLASDESSYTTGAEICVDGGVGQVK